jgi:hypothetical protein
MSVSFYVANPGELLPRDGRIPADDRRNLPNKRKGETGISPSRGASSSYWVETTRQQ